MGYDYGQLKKTPLDPKFVRRITRSATMRAEQGADWLSGYGGPGMYQTFTKMPVDERLCYAAVLEGNVEPGQIEIVTGLSPGEVSSALARLRGQGLVAEEEPIPKGL